MPIKAENLARTGGQNRLLSPLAHARRRNPTYPPRVCDHCGKSFAPYREANIRFCSTLCRRRSDYRKANPKQEKSCRHCRAIFTPQKSNKRDYCSDSCRAASAVLIAKSIPQRVDARRATQRRYTKSETYRFNQKNCKARRRSVQKAGRVSAAEWQEILTRYNDCCAYCGESARLTMDHVTPLSKGGKHEAANIVPACQPCNSAKCDRDWSAKLLCR